MVWDLADVLMGLMALVNLVAILLLGKGHPGAQGLPEAAQGGEEPRLPLRRGGRGQPGDLERSPRQKWED